MSDLPVQSTASASFSVPMWAGDLGNLQRIIEECINLQGEAKTKALDRLSRERSQIEAHLRQRFSDWDDEAIRSAVEGDIYTRSQALEESLSLEMVAIEKKWENRISGPPASVMDRIDASQVKSLTVSLGDLYPSKRNGGYGLRITFKRERGCRVDVTAPTSDWLVLASKGALREKLMRARPWYWWVLNRLVLTELFAAASLITGFSLIASGAIQAPAGESLGWYALFGAICAVPAVAAAYGVKVLVPAFELSNVGEKPRGRRVVVFSGSVAVWVLGTFGPFFIH